MVVVAILLESFGCLCLPLHWLPPATVRSPRGALVLVVYAFAPRLWRRGVLLGGANVFVFVDGILARTLCIPFCHGFGGVFGSWFWWPLRSCSSCKSFELGRSRGACE